MQVSYASENAWTEHLNPGDKASTRYGAIVAFTTFPLLFFLLYSLFAFFAHSFYCSVPITAKEVAHSASDVVGAKEGFPCHLDLAEPLLSEILLSQYETRPGIECVLTSTSNLAP